MRTSTIPVVVEALELTGKHSNKFIKGIPGSPWLKELLKIILTTTGHTLGKALSM